MTDPNASDTVTRIVAADDGTAYDNVAVVLHWATALIVLVNFLLAETWDWLGKPTARLMQSTHMSFGVLLAVIIVMRIAWRLLPGHQVSSLERGWGRIASKLVHYLLYTLLLSEVTLGLLVQWSRGHPLPFFGVGIPTPLATLPRAQRHELLQIHNWVAWAIVLFALGHALAALYRHYVVKDRVLVRMLPIRGIQEAR